MENLLERLLADNGPMLSSELTRLLVDGHGVADAAARKRVSRLSPGIGRVSIKFPRNASFLYLKRFFGTDQYWNNLTQAFLSTNSIYGLALAALRQRGDVMPASHWPIACGAVKQKKHLAPETVLKNLLAAGVLTQHVVPSVGDCIGLAQGRDRYENASANLRARMLTESILLGAIKNWVRNLGLVSYGTVAMRGDGEALPMVGTAAWDLTAPSYLFPLLRRSGADAKPGFFACDVLLGVDVNEDGLKPFIHKCNALRNLKNVGPCIQMFVAHRYTSAAFELAKQSGVMPATPETLFGTEVAEGLAQLLSVLRNALDSAINPQFLDEVFTRLGKIEGAANNLRGALFEYLVADIARKEGSYQIRMNQHFRDETGAKAEVDVIADSSPRAVRFIECKGYQPYGTIPEAMITTWLEKRVTTGSPSCKATPGMEACAYPLRVLDHREGVT
ncbi:hypothetical protein [Paraburkholderia kururiensis]|uniref:hypothetical protein n=1 Tax=Paraburkholderia kururiensis TaxID=984307 RepID=UPI000694E1D9|nr:hypothetical protein [Paraburkholderia kururiensis]